MSLVVITALAWSMTFIAALARERFWTMPGMMAAFGNRDGEMHPPSPFAGRADRAAKNTTENLVLFAAALLAAFLAGVPSSALAWPSTLFVGARLVYALLYWAGVKYVRTVAWAIGVFATAWIGLLAATGAH